MHPTQKPVQLPATAIERSCPKAGLVYEPFSGSGSTLIAVEQLGRKCYAMEKDPAYVDVILRRYFNLTNDSPVRKSDGKKFTKL